MRKLSTPPPKTERPARLANTRPTARDYPVSGAGLGLRRNFSARVAEHLPPVLSFMELAPENWIDVGGLHGQNLRKVAAAMPLVCHGLSLNLGGWAPLDEDFVGRVREFMHRFKVRCYSEHLSYCGDEGHLYDLMPIPFTEAAVEHVATRIRRVQEILEQRIAIENVSYYAAPGREISELEFLLAVLEQADCDLLLDINNIHVNSVNHGYDAQEFLRALPAERIAYAHIAGHYVEAEDLRIDTHAAPICDPVWKLLECAYKHFGVFPTLLERDFNFPPLENLLEEVAQIKRIQQCHVMRAA